MEKLETRLNSVRMTSHLEGIHGYYGLGRGLAVHIPPPSLYAGRT